MRFFGWLAIFVAVIGLSGCGSKFKRYYGPEVTQVQVHKADRKMYLFHNEKVLKAYDIGLGFAPVGVEVAHAERRGGGDGRCLDDQAVGADPGAPVAEGGDGVAAAGADGNREPDAAAERNAAAGAVRRAEQPADE